MKKILIIILMVIILLLGACNRNSMDYIISHYPFVIGVVEEKGDEYAIIKANDAKGYPGESLWYVSFAGVHADSYLDIEAGDEIVVYHDGNIKETYPLSFDRIYAINLRTPNNR